MFHDNENFIKKLNIYYDKFLETIYFVKKKFKANNSENLKEIIRRIYNFLNCSRRKNDKF